MKHKLLYILSLIITSVFLCTSCDDGPTGTIYDLGKGVDYVSFTSEVQSFGVKDETKVVIYAYHLNKKVSGTQVNVSVEYAPEAEGLFSVSSTQLVFSGGEPAPIEITFDPKKLEYNFDYTLTFTLSEDAQEYPLGSDKKTTVVKIKRALTFSNLGTGTFISKFWEQEWEQEVLLADQTSIYRLPDLHEIGYPIDVILNDDGTVEVNPQPAWYNDSYSEDVFVEGVGVIENNVLKMEIAHFIPSLGSFGVFYEELILPE